MQALITWHPKNQDPRSHDWAGYTFAADEPVLVTDGDVIAKLRGNPFFTVEEDQVRPRRGRPPKVRDDE